MCNSEMFFSPVNRINSYGTGLGQVSHESPFVLSVFIHRLDLSLLHTGPVYTVSNPIHREAGYMFVRRVEFLKQTNILK